MRLTNPTLFLQRINDAFNDVLTRMMQEKFGISVETNLDIITLSKVTVRVDGKPFTKEQHAFLRGFSEGYLTAMNQVYD